MVRAMKNIQYAEPARPISLTTLELSRTVANTHPDTILAVGSTIRHPRCLARPSAAWRPPSVRLPGTAHLPELRATLSRQRVGNRVKARVRGYGESRTPAYVVVLRFSDPTGAPVSSLLAEAWMRALVFDSDIEAIHQLANQNAPTFTWLVDGHYRPVHSPASLFEGLDAAA